MNRFRVPKFVTNAVTAGIFASFGSIFGKLSGLYNSLIVWLIFFIIMIVFNSIGLICFTKSLDLSSTSIKPTLISTATNFFVTALLSGIFYSETVGLKWGWGILLILFGILLVAHERKEKIK